MIRLAIPSQGSLQKESLDFLKCVGIKLPNATHTQTMYASNFPIEVICLPEVDILSVVQSGMVDVGMVGKQFQEEKNADVIIHRDLSIAPHIFFVSGAINSKYKNLESLTGKTITTPFPNYLSKELKTRNIRAKIQVLSESLLVLPQTELNEFFFDATPVGLHLGKNGLQELELVATFDTILVSNKELIRPKVAILEELLFRMDATVEAFDKQKLTMHVPTENLEEILAMLPSPKPPIVIKIDNELSFVQTVVDNTRFWDIVTKLKELKAEEIALMPITHLIH